MPSVTIAQEPTGPDANKPVNTGVAERPEGVPEKFWDAEKGEIRQDALLKSYLELEKKRGPAPEAQQNESGEEDTDDIGDQGRDDEVANVLIEKGLDPKRYSVELEQNGELSEESYAELKKAGFPREMVDQYIAGAKAAEIASAAGNVLAEKQIVEVKAIVGGDETFTAMSRWASKNVSPSDLKTYNDMVNSGNVAQAKAAVAWIYSMYTDANGRDPRLLGGEGRAASIEPFRSSAQVVEAMKDKRYKTDPAYREEVAKRLSVSSVW